MAPPVEQGNVLTLHPKGQPSAVEAPPVGEVAPAVDFTEVLGQIESLRKGLSQRISRVDTRVGSLETEREGLSRRLELAEDLVRALAAEVEGQRAATAYVDRELQILRARATAQEDMIETRWWQFGRRREIRGQLLRDLSGLRTDDAGYLPERTQR